MCVLEVQCLRRELGIWKTEVTNLNKITDQVSPNIRSAIKESMPQTPFPFHPSDVSRTHMCIPHHLESFLIGLITGDPDAKTLSNRVSTLIQSFSQDLI